MANRISHQNRPYGLITYLENIVFQPAGMEIASSLFFGNGLQTGTLRYQDATTAEWVTEQTWMVNSGLIGTGTPQEVIYHDMPGNRFGVAIDDGGGLTAPRGDATEGIYDGFVRFYGVTTPELHWDNTAENADEATARAEFAANAAAATADYLAQINAFLASPIRGRIAEYDDTGLMMEFRPDPGTTATYGDFIGLFQDNQNRMHLLGGAIDGYNDPAGAFGPDETVEVILTNFDDVYIIGDDFEAGSLSINAAGGDDILDLFSSDGGRQPDLLILKGGQGDDSFFSGAFFDNRMYGGAGNDQMGLRYSPSATEAHDHVLYGGAGSDEVSGAGLGTNLIYGGYGHDALGGGTGRDTIFGGDHGDYIFAYSGDDLLCGDAGQDLVYGGDGQDTLDGGAGNDHLYGDAGVETFHFGAGSGKDKIYGYEAGEILQIDAGFWSGSVADFIAANVHVNGNGILTIKLSATDNIRLVDGSFVPGDFADAILLV